MKAYGIWNSKLDQWTRDHSEADLLVFYSLGAAVAQLESYGWTYSPYHEVAEIGDDGLLVEVEDV